MARRCVPLRAAARRPRRRARGRAGGGDQADARWVSKTETRGMPRTAEQEPRPEQASRLKGELLALVNALSADADPRRLDELLASARRLLQQKLAMAGTKLATRQLLEELVNEQLRNCLKPPDRADRSERAERGDPAQVVLSTLLSGTLLAEFSAAIDRAILECSAPRDYSFAGRADFI